MFAKCIQIQHLQFSRASKNFTNINNACPPLFLKKKSHKQNLKPNKTTFS